MTALIPGEALEAYHWRAQAVLTAGLVTLGVLEGDPKDLLAQGAQKPFTIHHTGHFLGLDTHDVGAYSVGGRSRPLVPGMVVTVEPGLYFAPDDARVPEALRGIGVRIEDDVVITETGHEVLTSAIPKAVDAVESLAASA